MEPPFPGPFDTFRPKGTYNALSGIFDAPPASPAAPPFTLPFSPYAKHSVSLISSPTSTVSVLPSPVIPSKPPLLRLEQNLSRIRKLLKKSSLQKTQMIGWVTEVNSIFKCMFGEKNGLVSTLEAWKKELAGGHLEKFGKFVDDIEAHLDTLSAIAEGDSLTQVSPRLPRTFVGFSSSDIDQYRMLTAWAKHQYIPFNFCDCQIQGALDSDDESYIKRRLRQRIKMAGHYIMLIGKDTRLKTKYVVWEAEVALEKKCTIVGVNLDKSRYLNPDLTPPVIQNVGAIFVPFSSRIIAHALETFERQSSGNYFYPDSIYDEKGYELVGNKAFLPSGR